MMTKPAATLESLPVLPRYVRHPLADTNEKGLRKCLTNYLKAHVSIDHILLGTWINFELAIDCRDSLESEEQTCERFVNFHFDVDTNDWLETARFSDTDGVEPITIEDEELAEIQSSKPAKEVLSQAEIDKIYESLACYLEYQYLFDGGFDRDESPVRALGARRGRDQLLFKLSAPSVSLHYKREKGQFVKLTDNAAYELSIDADKALAAVFESAHDAPCDTAFAMLCVVLDVRLQLVEEGSLLLGWQPIGWHNATIETLIQSGELAQPDILAKHYRAKIKAMK